MRQMYEKYTAEDQKVWQLLYDRLIEVLPPLAEQAYLDGLTAVNFRRDKIPAFQETNVLLEGITGWNLHVVPGLIPNKEFFELLQAKRFPASTWLRKLKQLDYLQEPDMFHDVFGHVPLLANHDFCQFLQGLSTIALKHIDSEWAIELVSRIYWYTVEFGLIQTDNGLKIYGAGILSSSGESVYSIEDERPERTMYNVQEIIDTPYIKDKFQEKYFVISSYQQLYESLPEIDRVIAKEVSAQAVV